MRAIDYALGASRSFILLLFWLRHVAHCFSLSPVKFLEPPPMTFARLHARHDYQSELENRSDRHTNMALYR